MKTLKNILTAILLGGTTWAIMTALCEYALDRMKSTGQIIFATDTVKLNSAPYIFALFIAVAWFSLAQKEKW